MRCVGCVCFSRGKNTRPTHRNRLLFLQKRRFRLPIAFSSLCVFALHLFLCRGSFWDFCRRRVAVCELSSKGSREEAHQQEPKETLLRSTSFGAPVVSVSDCRSSFFLSLSLSLQNLFPHHSQATLRIMAVLPLFHPSLPRHAFLLRALHILFYPTEVGRVISQIHICLCMAV